MNDAPYDDHRAAHLEQHTRTTSGDSKAEVRASIKDAVDSYLESLREHNEPVPAPRSVIDVVDAA